MNLSKLKDNQTGVIVKVRGYGAFRKRILEMGFVKGRLVKVIRNAPLKDPVQYEIMGYNVSLRRSEARLIEVVTPEEAKTLTGDVSQGVLNEEILRKTASEKRKNIKIALVGNPNCGKTSIFNFASGSKEHVGNYGGVTIDAKKGTFRHEGYLFDIVDLPGTYSLSAFSPEELYVRKFLIGEHPDVIINVVDASNPERNLFLTTQLIDLNIRTVIALNMFDELRATGDRFDYAALGRMIGMPVVPTIGSKGLGLKKLFNKVIDVYEDRDPVVRPVKINYGQVIEKSMSSIIETLKDNKGLADRIAPRFLAVKLLEKDESTNFSLSKYPNYDEIKEVTDKEIEHIEHVFDDDSAAIITDSKYGFIAGALKETYEFGPNKRRVRTEVIDTLLTHKLLGFPVFVLFMWLMFQTTFKLGSYPKDWLEAGIGLLSNLINGLMPPGMLKELLIEGIISGVGGVLVFLPNILILFLFISFMEDTGYMARAAFIMDKLMHKIGLHGKSFIPLLMGFGCNVPAILATRTIENRNNRLLTIMINPFMSCSARLPVYILITGAFFPENAGTIIFILYATGILLAIGIAKLFKKILFKSEESPFVMELPPYRIPQFKTTLSHMWSKACEYLKKMGGVILIASILIWALEYFPVRNGDKRQNTGNGNNSYSEIQGDKELKKTGKKEMSSKQNNSVTDSALNFEKQEERISSSYIGHIGKAIQPVMDPLGFDWKMTVSLLTGVAAKEVVVSTLAVLYHFEPGEGEKKLSKYRDSQQKKSFGTKYTKKSIFNPLSAFAFLLFILIYFPCVAVIVTVAKEAGWKWAIFLAGYTTFLAWLVSFIVYQVGSLFM
jgi:ferrous iron transport protein B